MLVTEWAILRSVLTGLRTVFAGPAAHGRSYVEKNFLGMFGLILAVGALPEIPVHHLLIPGRDWPLALALDVVLVYSALWVLGIYGLMALRPHEVRGDALIFHRGPFAHVEVPRDCVERAEVISLDGREAKRRNPNACYLGVPGAEHVYVRLKHSVRVRHTYPVRYERHASELLVPSDRPRELHALLHSACSSK